MIMSLKHSSFTFLLSILIYFFICHFYGAFSPFSYPFGSVIQIAIILLLFLLIYSLFSLLLQFLLRYCFCRDYGPISLPWNIVILPQYCSSVNTFKLSYPYWAYSKRDGTADLRRKGNFIHWQKCSLYIDKFMLSSLFPYQIVHIVAALRQNGVCIAPCSEEYQKRAMLESQKQVFASTNTIQSIVNYYASSPTDFETLCAKLFQKMGFQAQVTPPSNDGGYDVILTRDSITTIVECKCYSINHHVGRPAIQKLVGANSVVHADNIVFITTSDFSEGAVQYAHDSGVSLINGEKLLNLLNTYGFVNASDFTVDTSEWQLNVSDLEPYVPSDIYTQFFH